MIQQIVNDLNGAELLSLKTNEQEGDKHRNYRNSSHIFFFESNAFFLDVVEYLISIIPAEAVNTQNEQGNTALHWAATNGHVKVVEALVSKGKADYKVKEGVVDAGVGRCWITSGIGHPYASNLRLLTKYDSMPFLFLVFLA